MRHGVHPGVFMTSRGVAAGLALCAAWLGGCAGSQSSDASRGSEVQRRSPDAAGPTRPDPVGSRPTPGEPAALAWTLGPLDAKAISVNAARIAVFAADDSAKGDRGGKTLVIVRGAPPDCVCAGRTWRVKRYEVDAPPQEARELVESDRVQPVREHEFTGLGGGAVGLVSEINRTEKVEVVFDPPMIVVPNGLSSVVSGDARIRQELRMRVHPLGDRSRVRNQGAVVNTIVYAGDEPVSTGLGDMLARKVRSEFTADLGAAKVTNVSDQWFVDNIGLVREIEKESTRVLGVSVRSNAESWTVTQIVR